MLKISNEADRKVKKKKNPGVSGKDVDNDFSMEECTSNFLILLTNFFASVVEHNFLFSIPRP
jgi:hypothetical protein